jgi:hypothetical protein
VDRALAWVLLLYPRQMRRRYGPEIAELTRDLIRLEDRSSVRLLVSLAVHGLGCRMAWFARARVVTAVAVTTSVACVALVNMGAASAKQGDPTPRQAKTGLHAAEQGPGTVRRASSRASRRSFVSRSRPKPRAARR